MHRWHMICLLPRSILIGGIQLVVAGQRFVAHPCHSRASLGLYEHGTGVDLALVMMQPMKLRDQIKWDRQTCRLMWRWLLTTLSLMQPTM